MKIDLNLEPKDYLKLAFLAAAALGLGMKGEDKSGERMAVLETKVERVQTDVTEIKHLLIRRTAR